MNTQKIHNGLMIVLSIVAVASVAVNLITGATIWPVRVFVGFFIVVTVMMFVLLFVPSEK